MSKAIQTLMSSIQHAMETRPKVGGFPYLAESLRQAGVTRNCWHLPSCQSLYFTKHGAVVIPGTPLVTEVSDIPEFNEIALVRALRTDQAGESSFPDFLKATWEAGVIGYDVDFAERKVRYFGALGESYVEAYEGVELSLASDEQ